MKETALSGSLNTWWKVSVGCVVAVAVIGCASASGEDTVRGTALNRERMALPPDAVLDLPATFEGDLPCADCPGIFYHLDLFEDRLFFLRVTYLGRGTGAIRDEIGSWVLGSEDRRLALIGGGGAPTYFRVVDGNRLRKLDIEGHDIESELNYDLRRRDPFSPIEIRLNMRGMYRYMADAALFEECLSGNKFHVAMEGDNVALERAYVDARREPGEPLMVSLQGRIGERPAMEGDAMVLTVVPERFIGVYPGETCGPRVVKAELKDTYWKLTRLGDQPVLPTVQEREPHLVLSSEENGVRGFSGCTSLSGSYTLDGDSIGFSPMASTMMACADGADIERTFFAALERVRSWRLLGRNLDFLDAEGELAARFEARLED